MNGKHFLIFTTEQGGYFKAPVAENGEVQTITVEEYEQIRSQRAVRIYDWTLDPIVVKPVFIALARVEDNHDFILGRSRDATTAP